ncbi:hypothetical protein HNY73_017042 [Argiope bruennichi]|uniref:Transposable element P transposase-like RNase H domain-containing protein n=1 Tax=Argiope bruennichi TaxID=94029 RepID=A0A8T0EQM1_ARGBR|nr:hypothetical protein HNY73_017042 [Argiope bruennichi]
MSIKAGLTYATDLDCVDGFTMFKQENNDKPPYAIVVLVFMARIKNWKQVLGYYFTSPTDNFSLSQKL